VEKTIYFLVKMERTKEWCRTAMGKTEKERRKCHTLLIKKKSKLPKRKYKKRK